MTVVLCQVRDHYIRPSDNEALYLSLMSWRIRISGVDHHPIWLQIQRRPTRYSCFACLAFEQIIPQPRQDKLISSCPSQGLSRLLIGSAHSEDAVEEVEMIIVLIDSLTRANTCIGALSGVF